jgi:molybdopterin-guanine dinucleotide biosynthesis protein A
MTGGAPIAGLLLAGGLSRRMGGGDKCLRILGGTTILARIATCVAPQVGPLALNANGDAARFDDFALPVLPDVIPDNAGPLAGVLTGLEWAAAQDCAWLATIPTDAPFLPRDLIGRMADAVAREGSDMACAASAGRNHPVVGLWPVRLRAALRDAMTVENIRKVDRWTGQYKLSVVDFTVESYDPFFNVNRPEDLERAEQIIASVKTI